MIYIIIWLLCGITAAYVYANKNRSWALGLLAGLIFGPIGVILALLTTREPLPAASKACPKCGTRTGLMERVCSKCGADIRYA
jgi:hypothetical protein